MPTEILTLFEIMLLIIGNRYRGRMGSLWWEIRGEPVEGSGGDIEPSGETDE